jgi:serine/threonine protein kinase
VGSPLVAPTEAVQLISMKQIKSIASQILSALALLKSMHIIHADIKPQNICIKNPAFVHHLVDQFALPSINPGEGKGKPVHFSHTALGIEVVLIDFSCSCYEDEKYRADRRRHSFEDTDEPGQLTRQVCAPSEAVESANDTPGPPPEICAGDSIDAVADAVADADAVAGQEKVQPLGFELDCGTDAPVIDDDSGILFFNHQHSVHPSGSVADPVAPPPPEIAAIPEILHGNHLPLQNKYIQSRFYRSPEVLLECHYGKYYLLLFVVICCLLGY